MVHPKHHFEIGTARATARIQHPQTFHLPISRGNILGYLSRSRSKSTQPESRTADVAVTSSSNFGTTLGAKVGELGVTSSSYRRWKCSVSSWTHFQIRDLQLFVKHRETIWNYFVCHAQCRMRRGHHFAHIQSYNVIYIHEALRIKFDHGFSPPGRQSMAPAFRNSASMPFCCAIWRWLWAPESGC